MTDRQYIIDLSHYDGEWTVDDFRRARAAGVVMVTSKLGEGTGGADPYGPSHLVNARDAGIPILGGYMVARSGDATAEANAWLSIADSGVPWWRDWSSSGGTWVWQTDLERWPYDNVSPSIGIAMSEIMRARTDRAVILYASHGQYGEALYSWSGKPYGLLWNANYGLNPIGDFQTIYPGDSSPGWVKYSGRVPDLLQYGSRSTVAGKTPTDISAYRGTLDQLVTLLGGTAMDLSTPLGAGRTDVDGRTGADVLVDLENIRNFYLAEPGTEQRRWDPDPGSRIQLLAAMPAKLDALIDEVKALSAPTAGGLTLDEIIQSVRQVMRDELNGLKVIAP